MKVPFNNKARWIDDVIWHHIPRLKIEPRRKLAASLVAPFRPRTPGFTPSEQALSLKTQLETRGYTDAFRLLTDEQVAAMRRYFEEQPCFDGGHRQYGSFTIDKVPSPDIQMARYVEEQFLAAPHLLDTINHPLVLEVAEAFHGCKPTIDGMSVWWSLARPNPRISTQNYHRDYNQVRHFKMFLYLTDTDMGGGPHIYVPASQHGQELLERRNHSDAEVEAVYGASAPVALTGRAGDCFLADNSGMHKALQPTRSDRLIVVTEYTLLRNRFGPLQPVLPNPDRRYDPYINRVYLRS
ncbi:phytanoyl-CoA dioxygenase family protein [Azospirillum brasilense]|uniref:Phytanoyl-CoA dioxygenase PhyH n=1 Tax=Azospirillum brasilense TaxID=192 RepID=A0A235H9J4_AZOBR|nr:phytanoyl-CoA dioxygenase family protein [Azospirillum brasilense]OYD82183.1 hypothetical protein CHT98_21660 [Azospirillum brasilense]